MSYYQLTPFKQPPQAFTPGTPSYAFGSWDDRSSPTFGYIISDSSATTTATVTFQVTRGPVPLVGDSITVRSASRSANFNINGTVLTVVAEADASGLQNGVVTVTYAIASTTLATASDSGEVLCSRVEVGDALVNGASVPLAAGTGGSTPNNGRTLTAVVSFPSLPTAAVINLQGADYDRDGEYVTLVPSGGGDGGSPVNLATVAGGVMTGGSASYSLTAMDYRFYRFIATGVSGGTLPTVVAKLNP